MEHLFYVSDPEKNEKKEILGIIEEGFKGVKEVCTRLQVRNETKVSLPFHTFVCSRAHRDRACYLSPTACF